MSFSTPAVFHSRDLLWEWTSRNIRARYQQSALGWLWAVIQPVTQVLIFSVIFTVIVPVNTGDVPYILFSYVAIVPWTFLSTSLPDMANSLVDNMGLVTKIYFPREILPVASMLARLLDFAVAAALGIVLLVVYQAPLFPLGLVYLPIILAIQVLLILGIGLACAALNVFLRDVRSLLVLGLQLWFYASPIIYPATVVPDWLKPLYYLNPMAGIITALRSILLEGQVPGPYLWVSAAVSILIFVAGYWFFKRVEFRFADIV